MTSETSAPEESHSVLDTIRSERSELQALVARELHDLKLPEQRFDIQASFLTFSPLDLGIRLVWPLRMAFQGTPTGVIQIGTKARYWNPESRVVMPAARLWDGHRLRKEIREWCRVQAAMTREAFEKRGGEWPRNWPRLQVRGATTINAMPTRPGTIATHGKAIKKRKR